MIYNLGWCEVLTLGQFEIFTFEVYLGAKRPRTLFPTFLGGALCPQVMCHGNLTINDN